MRFQVTTGAALLALAAAAGPLGAQTYQADTATTRMNALRPPDAPPASVTLPVDGGEAPLVGPRSRPIVEARVNGRGPFRFAVETGASFTAVTPQTAAALGLAATDTANPSVHVDSVSVGTATLRDFRIGVFPIAPGIEGILGLNAYRDLLLTVDYPAGVVRFERGTLPPANGRDLLALLSADGLWEVEIEVNGRRGRAVLDTQGSGAFNSTPRNAEGVAFEAAPVVTGTASGPGIGTQEQRTARLAGDIRVGDVVFRRPLVGVIPMPPGYPEHWNLGGPALREFTLTLDQRSRVLRLARPGRAPVAAPAPLRSIGFRTALRDGRRVVVSVTAGGEAERLGIAPGDEVVSVAGRAAAALPAETWNELTRAAGPVALLVRGPAGQREVRISPRVLVQ